MEIKSFNSNFYLNHKVYSLVNKKNDIIAKVRPTLTTSTTSGNRPHKFNQTDNKEANSHE